MNLKLAAISMKQLRWAWLCVILLAAPLHGQQPELNLKGAIDFHVHSAPDSAERSIDADDLARLAKQSGMRGLVLKNHWESTAALAYMVRKQVPGMEIFGGIVLNRSVGGINLEAVKRMTLMKGGWGRVVWLPTIDSESFLKKQNEPGPGVPVMAADGHLLPGVLELIDFIAQHHEMVLETGHLSAEEALLVVHEAHQRGVTHIVVTHAMSTAVGMTIPQMQQAARDGAYLEFVYNGTLGAPSQNTMPEFADAIHKVGAQYCILATDFGGIAKARTRPFHPQALLIFMEELNKEGIPAGDINLMAKTNPALALGLQP